MTLNEKVALLDVLKNGKSYVAVARQYNLKESTVRFIKKENEIRKTVATSFCSSAKTVSAAQDKAIIWMESALTVWITDCRTKNTPLDSNVIRKNARSLYHQFAVEGYVKEEEAAGPSKGFHGSKG